MNKIYNIVWSKTLGQWQAVSEHTKSNKKNNKKFIHTVGFLISGGTALLAPQVGHAACDIPAVPPSNSVVTCTGSISGTYIIRNVKNVQLTSNADWTLSGASTGIINADTGNLTGLSVTNNGSMTWGNANYGGSGTGARAVINVYTTGNSATQTSIINASTGVVTVNVTSNISNTRAIAGMAVYGGGTNSSVTWENAGTINVNSTSNNSNSEVSAGYARARSQVNVANTGTLAVTQSSGLSAATGVAAYINGGSTVAALANVTNSGKILVSSPSTLYATGVSLAQAAANANGQSSYLNSIIRVSSNLTLTLPKVSVLTYNPMGFQTLLMK